VLGRAIPFASLAVTTYAPVFVATGNELPPNVAARATDNEASGPVKFTVLVPRTTPPCVKVIVEVPSDPSDTKKKDFCK
jgi:hypothetical protein